MFNVSTIGHMAHIKPTVQFLPNTLRLQQLPLLGPLVHPRLLEGEAHTPILLQTPTKKSQGVRSGDLGGQGMRT